MNAGDRPHLQLTAEPLPFLRADVLGRPAPGPVQPVDHHLGLEEEPALRIHLDGPAGATDRPPAGRRPPRAGTGAAPTLPTTGASLPFPIALAAIGLVWVLRQRRAQPGT